MNNLITLNSIFERKDDVRSRLLQIVMKDPDTINIYAKAIGISSATLRNFLSDKGKPLFKTLCLISNYIDKHEQQVKAQGEILEVVKEDVQPVL